MDRPKYNVSEPRRRLLVRPIMTGLQMLMLLALLCVAQPARSAIPDSERTALINFYNSTNGWHWTSSYGWTDSSGAFSAPGTECNWYGISCDPGQTTVLAIGFYQLGNNLTGQLPSLADLPNLQTIWLGPCAVTGPIPPLQGLKYLQTFEIIGGQTGALPQLTGLSNLQTFIVAGQLTGSIPSLTGLVNLQGLSLVGNQLTGTIPSLTGLTNLQDFDVSQNQLTGPLPSLEGLANLSGFNVSHNQLTGTLPSLNGLKFAIFYADHNQLTGPMPPIAGMATLEYFRLNDNQLTGSIPSLAGLTNLSELELQNNTFSGSLPPLSGPLYLQYFLVQNNQLSGQIPALDNLPYLVEFNVANNHFSGPIPALTSKHFLTYFNANSNDLAGTLPSLDDTALQILDIGNNQLSGILPSARLGMTSGQSRLCPNNFSPIPDSAWDAVTGVTPWYKDCAPSPTFFTVTPSAGLSGSISPSAPVQVNIGGTTTFTVTPSVGFAATIGGTCGGNLVGIFYTTGRIIADCTVTAAFSATNVIPPPPTFGLRSNPNPSTIGTPVWFMALLTGNAPTGVVRIMGNPPTD